MLIAKVIIDNVHVQVSELKDITKGMIGAKVQLEFRGDLWNEMTKMAVFRGGGVAKDILNVGEEVEIPQECIAKTGRNLRIGIWGRKLDKTLVIPTLWADLGPVLDATDPSGDEAADPTLPIWAQLEKDIEELKERPSVGGDIKTDDTLKLENGILSVNTTDKMEQDNTRPITAAGVYATVGNIEALLKTI